MARILSSTRYAYRRSATTVDVPRLLLVAFQACIVGGIAIFVALAIANAILGAPQPEPAYAPFE